MKRIFISHASPDEEIAQRLHEDLRNSGHDVAVDVVDLNLGDDLLDYMNTQLRNANVIIILYSKHTNAGKWQEREITAALYKEVQEGTAQVIVVRLDDSPLPPLLAPKVFASLPDMTQYPKVLNRISRALLPDRTATSLVTEALAVGSNNPFWRVRAEYFDDLPQLMADAFAAPDAARMGILEEMMPSFLEGSRGTGKTMLLLSLRARILSQRTDSHKSPQELFGFYVRLERGAFCNVGLEDLFDSEELGPQLRSQIVETFAQEFYLCLVESLLSELDAARDAKVFTFRSGEEATLATQVGAIIGPEFTDATTLDALLLSLGELRRKIAEFVRRRFIYREQVSVPLATLDLTAFKQFLAIVRRNVRVLEHTQFVTLLDEYENLFDFQKRVVNSLVKLGPPEASVKIARKIGTAQTSATVLGQDLQEIHDYNQITLVYSVDNPDDATRYYSLLERIVGKLLKAVGHDDLALRDLLPEGDEPEVDPELILEETLQLAKLTRRDLDGLPPTSRTQKLQYYKDAATYRVLYRRRGARTEKRYCGARQLVFLSSGVIRYFQEILGLAYYLQASSATDAKSLQISPKNQSKAVHVISQHNLEALSRNVAEYGETLKYLLLDLGDCLREKLLRHPSEPEAGRLAITNPEVLGTPRFAKVAKILRLGVREGVFQTADGRPGMRPKHATEPQPVEFNIARIYAPALEFSPRLRWKSNVHAGDLRGLLDPLERKATKSKLVRRLVGRGAQDAQRAIRY